MKTFITTVILASTLLTAQANHFSALTLKMFDNGNFSVVLDDQPTCQSNVFSSSGIRPGYHKLKVIRFYSNPYGYSMIPKVVYKGWISIPPQSMVYAQINCMRQFDVLKVEPNFCPPASHGCENDWEDDDYGYNHGNNCGGNGWGYAPAPVAPVCLPKMEFMQLKNSIANKSFESSKMEIAKQAFASNYFSSAQVADMMTLFSFESSRLEFAKCAYSRVMDRQNYYLVNNAFSFESSIQELNQFIAGG